MWTSLRCLVKWPQQKCTANSAQPPARGKFNKRTDTRVFQDSIHAHGKTQQHQPSSKHWKKARKIPETSSRRWKRLKLWLDNAGFHHLLRCRLWMRLSAVTVRICWRWNFVKKPTFTARCSCFSLWPGSCSLGQQPARCLWLRFTVNWTDFTPTPSTATILR